MQKETPIITRDEILYDKILALLFEKLNKAARVFFKNSNDQLYCKYYLGVN